MTNLYVKENDVLRHPASLVKMMTALVMRDWVTDTLLDSVVTVVASDMHPPTTANLQTGDQLSWRDLLYGLMVPSGNDAALVVARVVGGMILASEGSQGDPTARFVIEMGRKAAQMGLAGAVFETPHGASDTLSRLTPRHVGYLLQECGKDSLLRSVMGSLSRLITIYGPNARTYTVVHTINPDGATKIPEFVYGKTGTNVGAGAGYCVAMVCNAPNGIELRIVVMGSSSTEGRFSDSRTLIDYGAFSVLRDVSETIMATPSADMQAALA